MTATSVIKIDVQDAAFKEFQKSFAKYQATLAHGGSAWAKVQSSFSKYQKEFSKSTGSWGALGKAANAAVSPFVKIAAAISVMNARLKGAPTYVGKMKVIAQSTVAVFDKVGKTTFKIAKNITSATLSLLKWAGIATLFGGVIGGGGLFGLDRLARGAAGSRRQSQGLGVTSGELASAQVNFSKFTDVNGTLESIANARSDLSKRWIFSALGVDPDKGSNVDVMAASLKAAKHSFEQNGMTQQGADAHGLTQLYSMDDLRRLHAMSDDEIDKSTSKYEADKASVSNSDQTLSAWQTLVTQLDLAGKQIDAVLVGKLSGLAGPLADLSKSIISIITDLASSPDIGKWISSLGDEIKVFAKYLGSDDFKDTMADFVSAIKQVSAALYKGFVWLGIVKPIDHLNKRDATLDDGEEFVDDDGKPKNASPTVDTPEAHWKRAVNLPRDTANRVTDWLSGVTASGERKFGGLAARNHNPGNLRSWGGAPVVDGFAKFSSDEDGLRAMGDQLQLYKKRGNDTLAGIIKKWAPASENDTNAYINDVAGKTGFKTDEHLDLNNREVLARLMAGMTKHENASSNFTSDSIVTALGSQASGQVSRGSAQPVVIEIRNNTGGSAIVSTNQLAH